MHKPLSNADIDYIKQARLRGVATKDIAAHLGCTTRTVQKYTNRFKAETIPLVATTSANTKSTADDLGMLERLKEARNILRTQMLEADPRNIASIVKEYRAVCEEVERIEEKDSEREKELSQSDDPLDKALAQTLGA
ncbi:helix-turn-helix domain-containing protein [Atopobium deltae]|uniref:Uncharacterized protein n=1 Tax=Atopobium deltae TaxID=1393034 RepID=A0A133XRS1_9ACTN|nr:helix-turn-helix domain-containing protein [Atopobium deltae]KXB33633.1 hypothetical protein HMPREF3192_01172 [Atopobium deltae]